MAWLLDWLWKKPLLHTQKCPSMASDFQVLVSNDEEDQRAEDSFPIPQPKSHLGVFNFGIKFALSEEDWWWEYPLAWEKSISALCLH